MMGYQIRIDTWINVKDKIVNMPSPKRNSKSVNQMRFNTANDDTMKNILTRLHAVEIRSSANANRFDKFEESFQKLFISHHESLKNDIRNDIRKLLNNNEE